MHERRTRRRDVAERPPRPALRRSCPRPRRRRRRRPRRSGSGSRRGRRTTARPSAGAGSRRGRRTRTRCPASVDGARRLRARRSPGSSESDHATRYAMTPIAPAARQRDERDADDHGVDADPLADAAGDAADEHVVAAAREAEDRQRTLGERPDPARPAAWASRTAAGVSGAEPVVSAAFGRASAASGARACRRALGTLSPPTSMGGCHVLDVPTDLRPGHIGDVPDDPRGPQGALRAVPDCPLRPPDATMPPMSNEKHDEQQDQQDPAPDGDDAPRAGVGRPSRHPPPRTPSEPSPRREGTGELDLHLRGEDAGARRALRRPRTSPTDEPDEPGTSTPTTPNRTTAGRRRRRRTSRRRTAEPTSRRRAAAPPADAAAGGQGHRRRVLGTRRVHEHRPVLWRIGFVVFGLTSVGVLAYIVAWLVMPEARRGEPIAERPPHEAAQITRWAAIGAIILGCWVVFRGVLPHRRRMVLGPAADRHRPRRLGTRPHGLPPSVAVRPAPPTPPIDAATYIGGRAVRQTPATEPSATSAARPTPPANPATPSAAARRRGRAPGRPAARPRGRTPARRRRRCRRRDLRSTGRASRPRPPRRREPSYLGRLVVGACAVVIGVGLVLNNTGVIDLTAEGDARRARRDHRRRPRHGRVGRTRALADLPRASRLTFALMLATVGAGVRRRQLRRHRLAAAEPQGAAADLRARSRTSRPRPDRGEVRRAAARGRGGRRASASCSSSCRRTYRSPSNAHVQGGEIDNFGRNNDGWDVGNT